MKKSLRQALLEAASDWVMDARAPLRKLIYDEITELCPAGHTMDLANFIFKEEGIDKGQITIAEIIDDSTIPETYIITEKMQHHVYTYLDSVYVEATRESDSEPQLHVVFVLKDKFEDFEIVDNRDLRYLELEELANLASHLVAHRGEFKSIKSKK
jgi:hypothetical protein